jgi:hypothetical protein
LWTEKWNLGFHKTLCLMEIIIWGCARRCSPDLEFVSLYST